MHLLGCFKNISSNDTSSCGTEDSRKVATRDQGEFKFLHSSDKSSSENNCISFTNEIEKRKTLS